MGTRLDTTSATFAFRTLRPHDVHVWSLRLDLAEELRGRLEALLSADEAARARRFMFAASRAHFVCAHGLLRLILAGYVGVPPHELAIERAPCGKPRLAGGAGPRFNLSHGGGVGLVAGCAVREVGVDVERVREVGGLVAERCFSPAERASLAAVAAPLRVEAFYAGWTRKEAFLKALGDGLSRRLDSFDVTLAPGEPARLLRVEGAPEAPARWALRALRPEPGYVGAVAVEGEGRPVALHRRSWETLAASLC